MNMRKSSIKVMHGKRGAVSIMEEGTADDGSGFAKVYSLAEWNNELARRKTLPKAELPELPTLEELAEADGLAALEKEPPTIIPAIEEDSEDEDKPVKKSRRTLKK